MRKLLPLILLLVGAGAGVAAGFFLRPEPALVAENEIDSEKAVEEKKSQEEELDATREYVKMNNQFVVPIVNGDVVQALVVLSLSLEVPAGQKDAIYAKEPKLRDSFLQVMFDHANVGGFDGGFTSGNNLSTLRGALREAGQKVMGENVMDVLIIEIARQDY